MFEILDKREVAPDTFWMEIEAPLVAQARQAGQFIIILAHERAERIPISLAGGSRERNSIYVVIQAIGRSTKEITKLNKGDRLHSVLGPLGTPTPIDKYGTCVVMGGGYGVAAVIPIAQALKEKGNRVIGIIGARSKDLLLLVDEMKEVTDEVRLSTDDGSEGTKGFVTDVLQGLIDNGEGINHVFAIGPVPMMRAVSELTRPHKIPTTVSLNATMVDGTGMCGGCRVLVGGQAKFACFDGPDFDGHQVDFDALVTRQKWYQEEEKLCLSQYLADKIDKPLRPEGPTPPTEDDVRRSHGPDLPQNLSLLRLQNLKAKTKYTIPRQQMPEQKPEDRVQNFHEVNLGLTPEQAIAEAARCLQCKKPKCVEGCPVNIDIPKFIKQVEEGDFLGAAKTIKEKNTLPAICGRVCPQETQCEQVCVTGVKHKPIAIGYLERFVADYERRFAKDSTVEVAAPTGKRVAVVGSGPAGLTCAGEMARLGHKVTVFEALHRPGGVLVYGIPEFRLPNDIVDYEIEGLKRMGVEFVTNALIGRAKTIDDLFKEGYDAVFLGTGAGLPTMLRIPGEELKGIYTANEFLTRVNLMRADRFPVYGTPVTCGKQAAVIGAGNTAMDAARTALRLNQHSSTIVYRRSREEAPARDEEIKHAEEEGIKFEFLTAPTEFIGDDEGWVKAMKCIRMQLGEPDASGRRRPIPIEGSEFTMEVDTVVSALGFGVNPLIPTTTPELETNKWGVVVVNSETGKTSKHGVFAGGDVVTGGATVILAMGQAKVAAKAMQEYLETGVF